MPEKDTAVIYRYVFYFIIKKNYNNLRDWMTNTSIKTAVKVVTTRKSLIKKTARLLYSIILLTIKNL